MSTQTQEHSFSWKAFIVSAVLIFLLPVVANSSVTVPYSIYVGIQTRGDMDVIQERTLALTKSPILLTFFVIFIGLVAFWRGRVMARELGRRARLHIILAVIVALVLRTVLGIIQSAPLVGFDFLLPWLVAEWVISLVGGYLGASLAVQK